jgi:hypothetical protein
MEEAKVISNIPLSHTLPKDHLIWQGTTNGLFSVWSAYHLGKEVQQMNRGECSNTNKGLEVWKDIWSYQSELGCGDSQTRGVHYSWYSGL